MSYKINKCKCGKLIKSKSGKRCSLCTNNYINIKKTSYASSMTEEEIELAVTERTINFRKRVAKLDNGKR